MKEEWIEKAIYYGKTGSPLSVGIAEYLNMWELAGQEILDMHSVALEGNVLLFIVKVTAPKEKTNEQS